MTEQQHPLTPPPEQLRQWQVQVEYCSTRASREALVAQIFAAGADQELEACVEWMRSHFHGVPQWADQLRAARRPKPPSLKEQALEILNARFDALFPIDADTIRRALEQLDD